MANLSRVQGPPQIPAAVAFDLDGTLFDRRGALLRALENWPGLEACAIAEVIAHDDEGRAPRRKFFEWWRNFLPSGIPGGDAGDLAKMFHRRFIAAIRPDAAMLDLLESLQAVGMPLALLSNGSAPIQRAKLRACGAARFFTADLQLYSSILGAEKPAPAAFAALSKALGVPAEKIVFCGDDEQRDIAGAEAAGMCAIRICRDANGAIDAGSLSAIRDLIAVPVIP